MVTSYEHVGISNHRQHDCFFNSLFGQIAKKGQAPYNWPFLLGKPGMHQTIPCHNIVVTIVTLRRVELCNYVYFLNYKNWHPDLLTIYTICDVKKFTFAWNLWQIIYVSSFTKRLGHSCPCSCLVMIRSHVVFSSTFPGEFLFSALVVIGSTRIWENRANFRKWIAQNSTVVYVTNHHVYIHIYTYVFYVL